MQYYQRGLLQRKARIRPGKVPCTALHAWRQCVYRDISCITQMTPVPFTQFYPKPALCIATVCKISEPYDSCIDTGAHPPFVEVNAIWDTGAMRSTISTQVAQKLGLFPIGQTRVCHADGESICNYYVVNLLLPNGIEVKMLMVNDGRLTDTDMLIGMDIITLCDFAITSSGAETKFSFQVPSCLDIDFEQTGMP